MAPVESPTHDELEQQLKDTIQDLYQIMLQVTTYTTTPTHNSAQALQNSLQTFTLDLQAIHNTAVAGAPPSTTAFPPPPGSHIPPGAPVLYPPEVPPTEEGALQTRGALPSIPRELVQYVENGRNPDIYTREFVELVRRGNQLMRGKMRAFAALRDTLAGEMRQAMPEVAADVARVVEMTSPDGAAQGGAGQGGGGGEGRSRQGSVTRNAGPRSGVGGGPGEAGGHASQGG
ncbi:hypothetical protein SODALDRAFT_333161 [Sodiomyces alkalinus F11]|uniref:Mediator of RNA polymerase II transcription subunit 10 n=1 Tax=Sodiomyces alkalinus (strain CBS 110278 / VKM F-3762 / F11) TaxID=1314773 RepID=A0A3N2PW21_SODAK|nr:hypothetical protein SODALDRAFT_333161 [Sodiomyces alkalinus F11]ROT38556.1 hypothetical protein SODALDRAFT_333161 [Sodiomyces alkalinus F11]